MLQSYGQLVEVEVKVIYDKNIWYKGLGVDMCTKLN